MKKLHELYQDLEILRNTNFKTSEELADLYAAEIPILQDIAHITGLAQLDRYGREVLDPHPVEIPVDKLPSAEESMFQRFMARVRREMASDGEYESWDEANDFNVGEDYDPRSKYEDAAAEAAFNEDLIAAAREIAARRQEALENPVAPQIALETPVAPQIAQGGDAPTQEATSAS